MALQWDVSAIGICITRCQRLTLDYRYDKETGTGGSNGATMRFAPEGDHGANSGLKAARDFLEPVKQKFPWITYSDLWTLAGVAAIQEMQGKLATPPIPQSLLTNLRPGHPLAPRPHRPRRLHVHSRRPPPRRRKRTIPSTRHLRPHGFRRPRDRRPLRRPRPRPLPHRSIWLRRAVELLTNRRVERLLSRSGHSRSGMGRSNMRMWGPSHL